MLFSDVWSEIAALFKRLMKIQFKSTNTTVRPRKKETHKST